MSHAIGEGARANAALIATAPEMLAALKEADGQLVAYQVNARTAFRTDPKWEGCAEAVQPTIDKIRAAIAKAELSLTLKAFRGETP